MIETILVTGFLGTGKTTFILKTLRPLLEGRRFAVLVNDFGEVGFDGSLLRLGGLEVMEINGGCVCCTAGGALLEALETIRRDLRPDLLVIEGSGLASPYPLLEALETGQFALAGIPCLIDPMSLDTCARHGVFFDQVDAATLLCLSKCDLAQAAEIERARRLVRGRRGERIAVLPLGAGPPDSALLALLEPGGPRPGPRGASAPLMPQWPPLSNAGPAPRAVRSWVWRPPGLPRLGDLNAALCDLDGIYRVKGLCQFVESAVPLAFNWAFGYTSTVATEHTGEPYLVFLGPAAEASLADRLPCGEAPLLTQIADAATLPAGACDARPGAAFVDGHLVSELEAAELLLAACAQSLSDLVIVAPPSEVYRPHRQALEGAGAVWIEVPDYRFSQLTETRYRLARLSQSRILLLLRSAASDWLLQGLTGKQVFTISQAFCLPRAAASLRGLGSAQIAALLGALSAGADQDPLVDPPGCT